MTKMKKGLLVVFAVIAVHVVIALTVESEKSPVYSEIPFEPLWINRYVNDLGDRLYAAAKTPEERERASSRERYESARMDCALGFSTGGYCHAVDIKVIKRLAPEFERESEYRFSELAYGFAKRECDNHRKRSQIGDCGNTAGWVVWWALKAGKQISELDHYYQYKYRRMKEGWKWTYVILPKLPPGER